MANKESDDVTKDLVPTVEEKHSSLAAWWDRYKETFSGWYMSLTLDEQTSILRKACPGIPTKCPKSRAQSTLNTLSTDKFETIQPSELSNETTVKSEIATESAALNQFKPTDLLLPELNEESMIALQGKILLLLLGRRLQTPDLCYRADINLLNGQLQKGVLPQLSNGQLDHINTPFVDPMDEEENVRSFGPELTAETRATFKEYFETGRLVRAEVWLCLKVRRAAMVSFIEYLVLECERCVTIRDANTSIFVPSYEQLVRAELEQLVYFSEEATKARADEEEVARQENGGVPKSEYKQTSHALEELA